jgi:anoctamin-10/anoctamin-7
MKYEAMYGHRHVFRAVDRINLLLSIMQAKRGSSKGAGLNIIKMLDQKVVLAAFPMHDYEQLKKLQVKWLNLTGLPGSMPIEAIREYFGERIGLYFVYLQHYVSYLLIPAFIGFVLYVGKCIAVLQRFRCFSMFILISPLCVVQKALNKDEYFMMPVFAVYIVIWTTFYSSFWKQRQGRAAMMWGSSG